MVLGASGDIVSAAGNVYAIDAAGQITENGTVMSDTNAVTELAYVHGTVYQEATSQNLWWSFNETTNQWTQVADPLPSTVSTDPPPTPSADGTVVVGTNGDVVSAAGNVYAIDAAGQITENGTVLSDTNAVTELAYVHGTVYQEATSQNLWWSFNETTSQWTQVADPLSSPPPTPSADGTVVVGASGDIISAAGNVFAIDAAGQITENGTVMSATNAVTELAYVHGSVYQEATSQNLWWAFNETTNQWIQTGDPLPATTPPSGTETLTIVASGDHWAGAPDGEPNPEFVVLVNGQQVGGVQTVTADYGSNQWQDITVNIPTDAQQIGIKFINDQYGGSPGQDINLHIDSIVVNGTTYLGSSASNNASQGVTEWIDPHAALLLQNGTATFTVAAPAPTPAVSLAANAAVAGPSTTTTPTTTTTDSFDFSSSAHGGAAGTTGGTDPTDVTSLLAALPASSSTPAATTTTSATDPAPAPTDTGGHDHAHLTLDHLVPHSAHGAAFFG